MAALACAMLPVFTLRAQEDRVMQAMRDEMARSVKQLTIENLEKPYYIAYRVVDQETYSVAASFGALNHSNTGHARILGVEVRVGDYKLDNSGFFSINFDMGASMQINFTGRTPITTEDDSKELRRQIWLATDAAYKKAVEDLSKKRASLQNKTRSEEIPDFSKEDPATTTDEWPAVKIDRARWESEARNLSALFRNLPAIATSNVSFNATLAYTRYLNSEGTSYTRRQPSIQFNVNAATQAADGSPLDDFVWYHGRSPADLPAEDKLAARVRELGAYVTALRDASTLANYNGPVLVEGEAAPQLIRLVFAPSLLGTRPVTTDLPAGMMQGGRGQTENPFLDRVGARVMPDFLSLTDNPLMAEYQGHPLQGISRVDEDGVPSREVKLVENGILKALLTSRDPVRGFERSTGSRHAGQATPSNLIATSANGLSNQELRAKFIALLKQRNREFGIVVRRMRNVNNAMLAYKMFPDGHEQPVRSLQFFGLNAASFKDILATSKDVNVLTVQYRPAAGQFPSMTFSEEDYRPVTVVSPSLLFEDATMRRIRAAAPNPPVATHPFFDK